MIIALALGAAATVAAVVTGPLPATVAGDAAHDYPLRVDADATIAAAERSAIGQR